MLITIHAPGAASSTRMNHVKKIMSEDTTIILSPIEATQFIAFQKNYQLFSHLMASGCFDVQFGKVVINIAYGQVQNIVKEEVVWKK
jgi:hypothetical protein